MGRREMRKKPIITLLSDFGLRDPYVAEMKAVILSVCPNATVVDVSHDVKKFDVRMGAFILAQAAPYFPTGTVHMAVVDPGVGTKRRPIIIETKRSLYVGPDNGLLMLSARQEGLNHVYEIADPKYMLKNVSRTFHGRDVFSSAAAHLANGVSPSDFGPEICDPVTPSFAKPSIQKGTIRGEVVYVDGFGNIITNINLKGLEAIGLKEGENLLIRLNSEERVLRLCSAYGEAPKNSPLALIGGTGFFEVSVNQGDASRVFNAKTGDMIVIRKP
ncbi:MAG: S-adenosyl-l-methionine hydroxide adenosyltransferase family protein [Candidatus Bathyarchaeota archaeon]|nr:S-adenosyl-l-methionine hydroxide adenosyltransferase family protein [Candidatus Bathyarchaeota archaeon]